MCVIQINAVSISTKAILYKTETSTNRMNENKSKILYHTFQELKIVVHLFHN